MERRISAGSDFPANNVTLLFALTASLRSSLSDVVRLSLRKGEGWVRVEAFLLTRIVDPLTFILPPSPRGEADVFTAVDLLPMCRSSKSATVLAVAIIVRPPAR